MQDRQLILRLTAKDFEVQTFRAGGKGGQYQNKTESGVRIIHPASGASAESREERSQLANKKKAFRKLAKDATFTKWLKLETNRRMGLLPTQAQLEAEVDAMLQRDLENGNILIEEY